ncbi:unnamed protein product [Lampetra planeri]
MAPSASGVRGAAEWLQSVREHTEQQNGCRVCEAHGAAEWLQSVRELHGAAGWLQSVRGTRAAVWLQRERRTRTVCGDTRRKKCGSNRGHRGVRDKNPS